jgi:hypothetical protein
MRRISASTNMFFFMFARHIRSGSPVLADCARTNSSGVCVPVPIGSVALEYNSPALAAMAIRSSIGIARSAARARDAFRASRWISPPFARLTVAMGSPVEKWTTASFSSES